MVMECLRDYMQKGSINMEFISAEEFSKQPVEVQKFFIDWWKPSFMDLLFHKNSNYTYLLNEDFIKYGSINKQELINIGLIPLFTEGQLRKFIEDNTGYKVRLEPYQNSIGVKGIQINLVRGTCLSIGVSKPYYEEHVYKCFEGLNTNAIKAYWEVAVKIASQD